MEHTFTADDDQHLTGLLRELAGCLAERAVVSLTLVTSRGSRALLPRVTDLPGEILRDLEHETAVTVLAPGADLSAVVSRRGVRLRSDNPAVIDAARRIWPA